MVDSLESSSLRFHDFDFFERCFLGDGGGSNGTRVRLWKVELQKLADATGLVLRVQHAVEQRAR